MATPEADSKKSKVAVISIKSQTQGMKSMANVGQFKSIANLAQGKSMSRMKVRKQSFGFGNIAGIRPSERRSSQLGLEYKRPPLLFLNTYQLEPRVRFHVPNVVKAIDTVLDAYFSDHKYSIAESPALTMTIAGEVMRNIKVLGFNRYRIIAVVTLAQKRAQSYNNAVAFLWDHERDAVVDIHREVTSAFIQTTVFGVYLD